MGLEEGIGSALQGEPPRGFDRANRRAASTNRCISGAGAGHPASESKGTRSRSSGGSDTRIAMLMTPL